MGPKSSSVNKAVKKDSFVIRILQSRDVIVVSGISLAPEVTMRYRNMLNFIDGHIDSVGKLTIVFAYETFNCSSAAYILKTIKKLNHYHALGHQVGVYWICNSTAHTDMHEAGKDFQSFSHFNFKICP